MAASALVVTPLLAALPAGGLWMAGIAACVISADLGGVGSSRSLCSPRTCPKVESEVVQPACAASCLLSQAKFCRDLLVLSSAGLSARECSVSHHPSCRHVKSVRWTQGPVADSCWRACTS